MIASYLRFAFRQLILHKGFTFINVTGLVVAISISLLVAQFVANETSYDSYLSNASRVFRIREDRYKGGALENQWAAASGQVGPSLKEDLPEVEEYAQVFPYALAGPVPSVSTPRFMAKEPDVFFASDRFFEVFTVPILGGKKSELLTRPNTVAISQSMAKKYFEAEDPVGRTVSFDHAADFEITGVFEDFPPNAHFRPQLLIAMSTQKEWGIEFTWVNGGYHTYVLLRAGVDKDAFEEKLPAVVERRAGEELKKWNEALVLKLQLVRSIHLDSHYIWEYEPNGDRATTYFVAVAGLVVLLIALFNYINLSMASSLGRIKEVGIRKVTGGLKGELFLQFLLEASITPMLALAISMVVVLGAGPKIYALLSLPPPRSIDFVGFWMPLAAVLSVCLLAYAAYPAILLSRKPAIQMLRNFKGSKEGTRFFGTLTVAQIAGTLILMIVSYCVYMQIRFMRDRDYGFANSHVLVVRAPNRWDSLYDNSLRAFKQGLLRQSTIKRVATSSDVPGVKPYFRAGGVRRLGAPLEEAFDCTTPFVDYQYLELLGLQVLAGRTFSEEIEGTRDVVINERALARLNWKEPAEAIDERITFWRDTFRIVGVVKDYHHESFKSEILPMIFRQNTFYRGFISVEAMETAPGDLLSLVRQSWDGYFREYPFEYFFMDDNFFGQYQTERQFERLVSVFAISAIIIACMGLAGLSMLSTMRRVKEVAVRKALGANVRDVLLVLNKEFLLLMTIGLILSFPISLLIVRRWLEGYTDRITLNWSYVAIPTVIVSLAAITVLGVQSAKVAAIKVSEGLRSE